MPFLRQRPASKRGATSGLGIVVPGQNIFNFHLYVQVIRNYGLKRQSIFACAIYSPQNTRPQDVVKKKTRNEFWRKKLIEPQMYGGTFTCETMAQKCIVNCPQFSARWWCVYTHILGWLNRGTVPASYELILCV